MHANISETLWDSDILNGSLTDFNTNWYILTGFSICLTMSVNIMAGPFNFISLWCGKGLRRFWDNGTLCCCRRNLYKSKKRSIYSYVDLYSGPEFKINFRYTYLLNYVFVTLMYGVGMPILFVFALLALSFTYIWEKILLHKYYSLPPHFDHKISSSANAILPISCILWSAFGYWFLGNR